MLTDVVHGADVGVIQTRDALRLALEPLQGAGVAGEILREKLDRHLSLEPGVLRFEHLAHAALAKPREQSVGANGVADERFLPLGQEQGSRDRFYRFLDQPATR